MVMSVAERLIEMAQRPAEMKSAKPGIDWRGRLLDRAPFLVACLMLALIVAIYGSLQSGVFSLDELNLDTAAAMTLMLAATGQTIVLVRGGIDLSIGGMISLGTVLAATRFTVPLRVPIKRDSPSTSFLLFGIERIEVICSPCSSEM